MYSKIGRQTESAPSVGSGEKHGSVDAFDGDLIILSYGGSTCSLTPFAAVHMPL